MTNDATTNIILVAGLGYLGEKLADHLHETGQAIVGATKSHHSAGFLDTSKPYPTLPCDLAKTWEVGHLGTKLPGVSRVVHCASSGRGGADAYREVFLRGAGHLLKFFPNARLVFTSSTSVYPQTDGSEVTEASPAEPGRETGQILRETENLILEKGGTVLRLAGLYGPRRSVHLDRFLKGTAVIEEDDAHPSRYLNQLHREDAVAALALVLEHPDTAGQIYNVADDTPMTQRDCYEALAAHFERPVPGIAPADPSRKRAWTHKRVSNAKLRALGWEPRYPSFTGAVENDTPLVNSFL